MSVLQELSVFALRTCVDAAASAVGFTVGVESVDGVIHFLEKHFCDQSQQLTKALEQANTRARAPWRLPWPARAGGTAARRR